MGVDELQPEEKEEDTTFLIRLYLYFWQLNIKNFFDLTELGQKHSYSREINFQSNNPSNNNLKN